MENIILNWNTINTLCENHLILIDEIKIFLEILL